MKIVVTGPKGAGKSSIGAELAKLLEIRSLETDEEIEQLYACQNGENLSCREIYQKLGEMQFRAFEAKVVELMTDDDWRLVMTGGSVMFNPDARRRLREGSIIIYLTAPDEVLWERATKNGMPPWLEGSGGRQRFSDRVALYGEVVQPFADLWLDTSEGMPQELAERLTEMLAQELLVRTLAPNTYGEIIRMTSFGESHGPAIGAVLDGVRPGTPFEPGDIQAELNRRRPGQSNVTTPRDEKDRVQILSGVFEGKTTGAPIAMVIFNRDQDSSKYEGIKDLFRPGHADFTYYRKYGIRDHRGGGRSSGRETAGRVMCGALARKVLEERGVRIVAHAAEIAGIEAQTCDYSVIESNAVRCADPKAAKAMEAAILAARDDNDSVGGIVQLEIEGVPVGLGDPVFGKLDARLTSALMTLGATKGIEVGGGFGLTRMRGSKSNDGMGKDGFLSNNAGGINGGISTGAPIRIRIAVKPTSSIATPQRTVDMDGNEREIEVHGRHDPCIVPRVIPVVESMAALVLLDAWEMQSRLRPEWNTEADHTR
ncbi:MAG: chorismate synthase [Nitrospiraceae bacterium]|nr:chorismate synthase [Nitrospiraceae bacterium]